MQATLDNLLINFANDVAGPLTALVSAIAFVLGCVFLVDFALRLRRHTTDPTRVTGAGTVGTLLAGGLLISFAALSAATTVTLAGGSGTTNTFSSLAYVPSGQAATQATAVANAFFIFVELVGEIALARSIVLFRRMAIGDVGASRDAPWTHAIGGIFAINVVLMIKAAQNTFGLSILN